MSPTAGSNMPCTVQAVDILKKAKVTVAPAKATAAGGVMHHF
jgi:glutamate dehydrogenase (NADP+)